MTRNGGRTRREEDELIWWPPQSVLDLARLAVDSGGDPAAIHRALDPTMITVRFVFFTAFRLFLLYIDKFPQFTVFNSGWYFVGVTGLSRISHLFLLTLWVDNVFLCV